MRSRHPNELPEHRHTAPGRRALQGRLLLVILTTCFATNALALMPTTTFQDPVAITAGDSAINLGSHAAPRLVDWNNDGVLDLIVGGGDGYLWLFLGSGPTNSTAFQPGVKIQSGDVDIRVGTSYTGVCFKDMDGDGLPDLVVAGSDN